MRARLALLLLTAALLTTWCRRDLAQTPPVTASPAPAELGRCSFPLTWLRSLSGHGPPTVDIVLNHKIHATFTLDTGAYDTIITGALAKQLGLTPQDMRNKDGTVLRFDKKRAMQSVHLDFLTINPDDKGTLGKLEFDGEITVLPGKNLFPGAQQNVDGILGMNMLSNCTILLDAESQWVTLWVGRSLTAGERSQVNMGDAVEIPLTDRGDKVLQVLTRINDALNVTLNVDTGADSTCIPATVADKLRLEPNGPGHEVGTLYGHGHVMEAYLRRIAVGGMVCSEQLVSYVDKALLVNEALGIDVLGQFRVLIDPANKKMYLKRAVLSAPSTVDAPKADTPTKDKAEKDQPKKSPGY